MIFHEFFHYIGLPPPQKVNLKQVLWKTIIFQEFFHYIDLPPQSVDLKRVLWKSIISQEKLMFWGADSRMTIKPD